MEPLEKRTKKVITWVCQPIKATLNIYDNILKYPELNKETDIKEQINKESWKQCSALVDRSILNSISMGKNFRYGQVLQAERLGYICLDELSTSNGIIFNLICFLKIHNELKNCILSACNCMEASPVEDLDQTEK